MPQAFLETGEHRLLVSRFDIDHPFRREPDQGECRCEQVLAGHAPQHAPPGPRRDPGSKECGGSPVDRAVSAPSHFVQRPERQPAFRQALIDSLDAERQDRPPAPRPALKALNALTKRLDYGNGSAPIIIAGLVPAMTIGRAQGLIYRDGRDEPDDRTASFTAVLKARNALTKGLEDCKGDRRIHGLLQLAWGPHVPYLFLLCLRVNWGLPMDGLNEEGLSQAPCLRPEVFDANSM